MPALNIEASPMTGAVFHPAEVPHELEKRREYLRGWLAIVLVSLLCLMVLTPFLFLTRNAEDSNAALEILKIVLSPVAGLVGAVTGFYFGEKSKE